MVIRKILVTVLLLSIAFSKTALSADRELSESSQCNRYFSIYEKQHHMPSNMLRAISITESGKWKKSLDKNISWPWTINVGGKGFHYNSKIEAVTEVKKLLAKGRKSIDIGCMQINLKYHPDAFKSIEQAFEPKYNIEYAAKFLSKNYKKHRNWEDAIRHYHNANPAYSDKYIARVYDIWRREDKATNIALLDNPVMYITVKPRPIIYGPLNISEITKEVMDIIAQ